MTDPDTFRSCIDPSSDLSHPLRGSQLSYQFLLEDPILGCLMTLGGSSDQGNVSESVKNF